MFILNISILIVLVLISILLISVVLANKKSEYIFLQILAGCILITVVVGIVWFLFSIERGYSIGLIVLFAIPFILMLLNKAHVKLQDSYEKLENKIKESKWFKKK